MDDSPTTRPRLRLVATAPGPDAGAQEPGRAGETGGERTLGSYDARLPFSDASANLARKELVAQLAPLEVGRRVVEDATTVLHELVRNGTDHGRPCDDHTLDVSWSITDASLTLHVRDCGATAGTCAPACDHTPAHAVHGEDGDQADHDALRGARAACSVERWRHKLLTPAPADAVRGRGLHLVDALSSSWDVSSDERGTTVTASVDLD